jgi:hypothetical protein
MLTNEKPPRTIRRLPSAAPGAPTQRLTHMDKRVLLIAFHFPPKRSAAASSAR